MSVFDETWRMALDGRRERVNGDVETTDGETVCFGSDNGTYADEVGLERARLIAAAPALYRALLGVEWSGEDGGGYLCPCCKDGKNHRTGEGHLPDCALHAALKKARGE